MLNLSFSMEIVSSGITILDPRYDTSVLRKRLVIQYNFNESFGLEEQKSMKLDVRNFRTFTSVVLNIWTPLLLTILINCYEHPVHHEKIPK